MSPRPNKNAAWEELFKRHDILKEIERAGVCQISSREINEVHEARLITKFDYRIQLPEIFKRHQLTIQPNTRGTYLIGHFESYQDVPDAEVPAEDISFPRHIETIDSANLYSESAVLLCAYHTGVFSQLFDQEVLLTVFGRMSSGAFEYRIRNNQTGGFHRIKVEGAQIEIDCGVEGDDVFAIFEAKNEVVSDFHVRQLYYPYRSWLGRTRKRVVPVFLCYSNADSAFSVYVYRFNEETVYNSIELVGQRKFRLVPSGIGIEDVAEALDRARVKPEPRGVPFPQADSFPRVIDLLTQLYGANGNLSQEYITTNYAFDLRQTQYYTNAASYLGLLERHHSPGQGVSYALTKSGADIMRMHPRGRNLALVRCALERRVFNRTLRLYLEQGARPTVEQVVEIMKAARLSLAGTTLPRRAQTVLLWIDWILGLTRQ
jgi:hypothetical protein